MALTPIEWEVSTGNKSRVGGRSGDFVAQRLLRDLGAGAIETGSVVRCFLPWDSSTE
jgi:hypothetical protein